jgi:hypothetical protein
MFRSSSLLVFILLFYSSFSFAVGGATSNGGDPISAEFVRVGKHVADIVRSFPAFGISAEAFSKAVNTTQVFSSTERLFLNGQEVAAINTPGQKKIVVSRPRWIADQSNTQARYVLVAHEYFGIMGIDDRTYKYSQKIFSTPGPAKSKFKCDLFNNLPGWDRFKLFGVQFEKNISTSVKTDSGVLFGQSPMGDTMAALNIDQMMSGKLSIATVVNLGMGFIMLDVPISKSGKIMASYKEIGIQNKPKTQRHIPCIVEVW